jgi:hypothetical protein
MEKSPRSKARGTPAASSNAPAIWTSVVNLYTSSSGSYADANVVKFIHAHQIAKNTAG